MFTAVNFFRCVDQEWTEFLFDQTTSALLEQIQVPDVLYPDPKDVFKCFYLSPFQRINVVVVGLEPVNDTSTGLAFEVKPEAILTPDLLTIYTALKSQGFFPTHDGNLEHWARQGVFLLNAALTRGSTSHVAEWRPFYVRVMERLAQKPNLIWLFLGVEQPADVVLPPGHTCYHFPVLTSLVESDVFRHINDHLFARGIEKIGW